MINKKCSKCKKEKELNEFHRSKYNKDGYHHYCKLCNSRDKKDRYTTDENYRNKIKNNFLKNTYNLSKEEVELKLEKQNYECSICNNEIRFRSRKVHIDHNHKTGKVRDILCSRCNLTLGYLNEDLEYINKFISYIKKHSI